MNSHEGATLVLVTAHAIELTKHEGLGNDFLIAVDPPRSLRADDAVAWCDRRRGVGADGLIMLTSSPESAAPFTMTLWNADGSRAEISGNGIRCVAQALARHLGHDGCQRYDVLTDAGVRRLDLQPTADDAVVQVRVDMGAAKPGPSDSDRWDQIDVEIIQQMGVDMGNPHLVALVADVSAHDIGRVGSVIEADYADGLNVHLIQIDQPDHLTLRVWERGAGVTEACGSGACAAGYAARTWGLVEGAVTVAMPGGEVTVDAGVDAVLLTGPARFIATVHLTEPQTTYQQPTEVSRG